MARIHNTKKRMPAMLRREDERRWLEKGLGADDIRSMLRPYDDKEMEAWTVSRLITSKGNKNVPAVIAPFIYRELEAVQERLF
jgi:putative SOS response-associated peptidase YedK